MGTRCFHHYLMRLARTRGLVGARWYENRRPRIETVLHARYRTGLAGLDGCPPEELIDPMSLARGRPLLPDKIATLMKLIALVDARARKDHKNG